MNVYLPRRFDRRAPRLTYWPWFIHHKNVSTHTTAHTDYLLLYFLYLFSYPLERGSVIRPPSSRFDLFAHCVLHSTGLSNNKSILETIHSFLNS